MTNHQVFYVPGQPGLIDLAVKVGDQLFGHYEGKSRAELEAEYPGLTVGDYDTVHAEQQNALKTVPAIISHKRYTDMLGALPPEDWQKANGVESFKLCEYYSGNITRIFARTGDKFYEFMDDARLPHAEIIAKIEAKFGPVATRTLN